MRASGDVNQVISFNINANIQTDGTRSPDTEALASFENTRKRAIEQGRVSVDTKFDPECASYGFSFGVDGKVLTPTWKQEGSVIKDMNVQIKQQGIRQ